MEWTDSGNLKTIFLQGVIPLVLGISLCLLGALYMLGIVNFRCCKKHDDQVAPVILVTDAGRNHHDHNHRDNGPMTRAQAERQYGAVACKANLWGMTPKERHAVLEVIFSKCDLHKNMETHHTHDMKTTNNNEGDLEMGDVSQHNHLDTKCSCAICLRRYGTFLYNFVLFSR